MTSPALKSLTRNRRSLTRGAAILICLAVNYLGLSEQARAAGWCASYPMDSALRASVGLSAAACSPEGDCDLPATRDLYTVDTSQPIILVRTHVIVLRNDDGSNPAASAAEVAASMAQLNTDFLAARIQFEYDWVYFNSSAYRQLTTAEDGAMKCASAVKPESTLNIWVTDIADPGVLGYSYLPWSSNALTCTYGCVIEQTSTGGFGGGRHVMSHEVGHALGLYHTFHGVDEVGQCGVCYENPGDPNADLVGDFCQDTRPTPTNFACGEVAGVSPCNSAAWAPTDYRNYMGYAPTSCQTHFSVQQISRMRCWTQRKLDAFIIGVKISADTTFGPAPLQVHFNGQASQPVTSWSWNFGDGGTSTVQNPTHSYGAGYFDVQATVQSTSSGTLSSRRPGFVSVYADTLVTDSVGAKPTRPLKVDVRAVNHLPLTGLVIPISWAGTMNLLLDSVRAGSRTVTWPLVLSQSDDANKRRTYTFDFSTGGVGPVLPVGSGPVLSMWFRVPGNAKPGASQQISVTSYALQTPTMSALAGAYYPSVVPGLIVVCRAGDVNNDNTGPDISDLTYLIAYLYLSGPVPPITAQADCDGLPGIDIGDLTRLIDYLFINGTPLVCGN